MPTALVIGASRGLGLGLAREFAGRGWAVTGTVRAEADKGPLLAAGADAEIADVTNPGSLRALRDALARRQGGMLDVLLLNAGVIGPAHQDAGRMTHAEAGALFLVNAVAPVAAARLLLDRLAPGGVVAFMSSRLGSVTAARGDFELYGASKAALNSLTRAMTATLDRPLAVLSLHPGWVDTDMGGPGADLDVATSACGVANVIAARRGVPGSAFLDHKGAELPW